MGPINQSLALIMSFFSRESHLSTLLIFNSLSQYLLEHNLSNETSHDGCQSGSRGRREIAEREKGWTRSDAVSVETSRMLSLLRRLDQETAVTRTGAFEGEGGRAS
jgi:hypothetical protein